MFSWSLLEGASSGFWGSHLCYFTSWEGTDIGLWGKNLSLCVGKCQIILESGIVKSQVYDSNLGSPSAFPQMFVVFFFFFFKKFHFFFFSVEEAVVYSCCKWGKRVICSREFSKWAIVVTGCVIVLTEYFLRNGRDLNSLLVQTSATRCWERILCSVLKLV